MKIEKGVAVPKTLNNHILKYDIPWSKMKPGDSVVVAVRRKEELKRIRIAIMHQARRRGLRIATRTIDQGLRIWRTA